MSRMTDFADMCCDLCGDWVQTTFASTSTARRSIQRAGWVSRRQDGKLLDICPACQNKERYAREALPG